MDWIKDELTNMTADKARRELYARKRNLISQIGLKGKVYIWGTGLLGNFAYKQFQKNNIKVAGYIDNNKSKIDIAKKVFGCEILEAVDIVVIASIHYPEIIEQLQGINIDNYIYYEELALADTRFAVYYQAFNKMFEELEDNKDQYISLYDIWADELSKEIYSKVIMYRKTLDSVFLNQAFQLSIKEGIQDFDHVVVERFGENCIFFDVGGFDGQSSIDFIDHAKKYKHIYFFEPDKNIIEIAKANLQEKKNISFINAVVGEARGNVKYDDIGNGGGLVSEKGKEIVETVVLDDFIETGINYIKMDIEGYEMEALKGAKHFIEKEKPLLAISVYHKPGDIHKLVNLILSWNPDYKAYIRHYTKTYADTVCYFI
jgi:FkbM family methyltransferase